MVQKIPWDNWFWRHTRSPFFSCSWQSSEFRFINPITLWWIFFNFFSEALKNTSLGFARNRSDYLNEKNPVVWNDINDTYVNSYIIFRISNRNIWEVLRENDFGTLHLCWPANNGTVTLRPNLPTVMQSQLTAPWVASPERNIPKRWEKLKPWHSYGN